MIERITVCGLGKLGACIASVFAAAGVAATGIDLDEEKVKNVRNGIAPVDEPDLQKMMNMSWSLTATVDVQEALSGSQACIFVTTTPSLPNGSFDNQYLLKAIEGVAPNVVPTDRAPFLFVIASTVSPKSCETELLPAIRKHCQYPFQLAYKPEFIALGTVVHDLFNPDVTLIGAQVDARSAVAELYGRVAANAPVHAMSWVEAELAKISLNCALTTKIAFANQVGMVAKKFGADGDKILRCVGADRRVGPLLLKPGLPPGGPCLPRDSRMFAHAAVTAGVIPYLAMATDETNKQVLKHIMQQIPSKGSVGILGLAYKPGSFITEESAGIKIRDMLLAKGREVRTHDVRAPHSHSLEETLACDAVVVATPWPEYRDLCIPAKAKLIDSMHVVLQQRVEAVAY